MDIPQIYDEFYFNYKKYGFTEEWGHLVARLIADSAIWCNDCAKTKIKRDIANYAKYPYEKNPWQNTYLIFIKLLEEK